MKCYDCDMDTSKRHGLSELLNTYEGRIVRMLTIAGLAAVLIDLVRKTLL